MAHRPAVRTTLALALLGALLVPTSVASAATDTVAPRLVGPVSTSPATVDVTAGDAGTTLTIRLTDDVTGVAEATVTLTSPAGWTSEVNLERTAGTVLDGTWTGRSDFSTLDPAGAWPASAVTATDTAGNVLTKSTGLGSGVTVVRTPDTTAPTLLGVTANVGAVDTTAGPGVVSLAVRVGDDLSGVTGGRFTLTSAVDGSTADGYLSGAPDSGTSRDGTWTVDVAVPARSTPGRWTLTYAELTDGQYNVHGYDAAGSEPPPAVALTVRSDDDTSTPTLTGFAVGPSAISTAYQAGGYVFAKIDFADTGSGLASAQVTLRRPDGSLDDFEPGRALFADSSARSGTSRSGRLTVGVFTDFVAPGTWSVASVALTDLAGNSRTYTTAELGARASFTVSAATTDTAAPTVTGLGLSPTRLDVRSGPAEGAVLIGVTDPDAVPAGFDNGTVQLTGPAGTQVTGTVSATDLADGDPQSGTFRAAFTLDKGVESGAWTITGLTLADAAAHSRSWTAATLATALGSVPTLTVLGVGATTAPGAPRIDGATATSSGVVLTWTAPADTGGTPVTGYVVTPYALGLPLPARTVGPGTSTTVAGLVPGVPHTFTVAAVNAVGTGAASAPSTAVTPVLTVPGAPLIGAVTVSGTEATVSWTSPLDLGGTGLLGYVVTPYLGTVAQPTVPVGATTSTTIGDLAKGRTYTFRVAALNVVGLGLLSSPTTTVSIAATAPGAPAGAAASVTGTTATVRWTPPADTGGAAITGYSVVGSPAGSCRTTTTTCTISGLTPATAYSFSVTATNGVGTGDASPASGQVVPVAPTPTTLTITSVGATVAYGGGVPVTGRLTRAGGSGVAAQDVRLQYRRVGATAFTTIPTIGRTSSTGAVSFPAFRPTTSVQVRLVAQPDPTYAASVSTVRTATLTRTLTLAANRTSVARGKPVVLTGRTTPAATGTTVLLQRWAAGKWTTVGSAKVVGGAYSVTVRPSVRGTNTYRAAVAGNPDFATSFSSSRSVRVT